MHPLWIDYLAASLPLCRLATDLIVPIGETLPDVPIIPAERSHKKPAMVPRHLTPRSTFDSNAIDRINDDRHRAIVE
jgi:hypothetical protein